MLNLDEIREIIGPFPEPCSLGVETLESIDFGTYTREKVCYHVEKHDIVNAYVFIPNSGEKFPAVFCHHQHQGYKYEGKDEPAGIEGEPDLAYAHELAEKGFITIAPDALGYGERKHKVDPEGYLYWEMATRLVQGKTLLTKNIHDIKCGIDYLASRADVDSNNVGYIGHSYGGRMGVWASAFDNRIKAIVCNCGCISYKHSIGMDAGIQFPFVVQGILKKLDIEDIVKLIEPNNLLISATTKDKWSRGAKEIFDAAKPAFKKGELLLKVYEGEHEFTEKMRENAYIFLKKYLKDEDAPTE